MAVPVRARHRLGDLREAAIGLAVPGETLVQDHHSFELAVPFAGEQRPGSKLGPFTGRRDPSGERSIARRSKRLALRLPDDAQRLLVEAAKRGGLDAIRQDPQEQPPRQMGGRGPAQVVAPLQAKAIQLEIDEAADHVIERRNAIRSGAVGNRASLTQCDCRRFAITPLDAPAASLSGMTSFARPRSSPALRRRRRRPRRRRRADPSGCDRTIRARCPTDRSQP